MKKTKVLLTLVCAILLVAASVMGTLAYLTSTATVTNTFTVGTNIKISLDEAKTNERGEPMKGDTVVTDKANADRRTGNTYKLMPGLDYTKDPIVHVTGGDCYVFVKVLNPITGIETSEQGYNNINTQITNNGWVAVTGVTGLATNETLYIYAKDAATGENKVSVKGTEAAPTNLPVFEKFKISSTLATDAQGVNPLSAYANQTIVINAYAVQKDGFEGKTPAEIWTAASFT